MAALRWKLTRRSAFTYYFWGLLDLVYVSWYAIESLEQSKIPFLDDLLLINDAYAHSGILIGATYPYLGWLLGLSACLSAALLLLRSNSAKFICYAQTPIRIICLAPSFSLVYFVSEPLLEDPWVIGFILAISEFSKVISLRKWA